MDESVIDDSDLPLERKSLLPGWGFFVPDDIRRERRAERVREAVEGADVVVVADSDADGLACVAIVEAVIGEAALVPAGPHDLEEALERVAEFAAEDATVFVCDLCPDSVEAVAEPLASLEGVRWFDHHQWDDAVARAVRDAGVDLVVGDEEECTADVAARELDGVPDHLVELAAVTRDHDLWLKEDPRSDDLADYAYWAEDAAEYVAVVREHGADLPEDVLEFLAERRVEKDALIERAVDRAELREAGPWTVGVTYGRCSQNEVADAVREQGADAAVVVKPSGSASIRGSEDFERCHEVARLVEGGGHPQAAGCKPDVYGDMLDYARHWVTQGEVAKREILAAFEAVAADADVETDTADADVETDTADADVETDTADADAETADDEEPDAE
jgi:oligoribonuclease NrnB/cAMP/cGMP phosphodiesterase (DHH superfamily)